MDQICLKHFSNQDRRYNFKIVEGILIKSQELPIEATASPQGFWSLEMLGLIQRKQILIAIFSDGQSIKMSVRSQLFNLSDADVHAKRSGVCFFANQFLLVKKGEVLLKLNYWSATTDPTGMGGDIFEYAERITKNIDQKQQFLKILNLMHADRLRQIVKSGSIEKELSELDTPTIAPGLPKI